MEIAVAVPAFLAAARFAGEVITDPRIGAAWESPSALPRMEVGDVAGHLFLIVRRVDKHLDEPADPGLPRTTDMWAGYPLVNAPDDLDLELHQQVRLDGHHVHEWGWDDVRTAFDARVEKLEGRLRDSPPELVAFGERAMALGDYLATRVVEVLVHADDLLVSIGDIRDPPSESVDVAVTYLVGAARRAHGDRAILHTFTRQERVPPGAPRIF